MSAPTPGQVRTLNVAEAHALSAARLVAVEAAPYYAHALFAMQALSAPGIGTCGVDAAWRLYVDFNTLAQWGPAVAGGVLVHEAEHLIRDHHARAAALGASVRRDIWNVAGDASINDGLLAAGIKLPDSVVTPQALDLDPHGIEEGYYAALLAREQTNPSAPCSGTPQDTGNGCGSGAGDSPAPWELPSGHVGDPGAPTPGLSDGEAALTRRRVAQAVREHSATSGRGTVPTSIQRWAEQALNEPRISWRRVLPSMVRRAVAHAAGAHDYTYARPGRRRIPRVVTPAMHRPLVTVAILIDTSLSMGHAEITAALSECRGVLRAAGVSAHRVTVLSCDAEVGATTRVRRVEDVSLIGGGGTDMRVGIAAAEALRPAPDVTVVLTDGGTLWPESPTRARLIVGLVGPMAAHTAAYVPAWARVLTITDNSDPAQD